MAPSQGALHTEQVLTQTQAGTCTVKPVLGDPWFGRPLVFGDHNPRHGSFQTESDKLVEKYEIIKSIQAYLKWLLLLVRSDCLTVHRLVPIHRLVSITVTFRVSIMVGVSIVVRAIFSVEVFEKVFENGLLYHILCVRLSNLISTNVRNSACPFVRDK